MFYTYRQNNSGGYYIEDAENGVAEYMIVEVNSVDELEDVLSAIGDKVDDFWDCCDCCGERWTSSHWIEKEELKATPMISGCPAEEHGYGGFIHYKDGTIKGFGKYANNNQSW